MENSEGAPLAFRIRQNSTLSLTIKDGLSSGPLLASLNGGSVGYFCSNTMRDTEAAVVCIRKD